MIAALALLPIRRLMNARRLWWVLGAWVLATIGLSVVRARSGGSATDALLGIYASFALPLVTLALTAAVTRNDRLQVAASPLTRVGASGVAAALAHVAVAVGSCLVLGSALGVAVAIVAHSSSDPSLARDAVTCAEVGALAGAAYAGMFSLGSSFGPKGSGRTALLVINWIAGGGVLGAVMPQAHVRSLLGGDPAGALSQPGSALALVMIAVATSLLAAWRSRRLSS